MTSAKPHDRRSGVTTNNLLVTDLNSKSLRRAGYHFAAGVTTHLLTLLLILGILGFVQDMLGWRHIDSTDKSVWERSGLQPLTDQKTGCEYLRTSGGAITPRLDESGLPICGKSQSSR